MKTLRTILILTALLMITVSAFADTQTQNIPFSGVPGYTRVLTFNQFDDRWGTLNNVTVTWYLRTQGGYLIVDNDGGTTADVDVKLGANGIIVPTVPFPTFPPLVEVSTGNHYTLDPDNGDGPGPTNIDPNPPDGAWFTAGADDETNSGSPASFVGYSGTSTFNVTVIASAIIDFGGVGGVEGSYGSPTVDGYVEIVYDYTPYNIEIHVEKATNGQDADSPTGPIIWPGNAVNWTYTVTNPGDVDLSTIQVSDNQGVTVTYQSGDDGDNILQTTETWIYTASGTAVAGQYANIATAEGDYLSAHVDDTDPSHYFGPAPDIHIEKATNGQDADSPTGPYIAQGSGVTWTYAVTNPGNVPISNVVVLDDNGTPGNPADDFNPSFTGGDTNSNSQLDVGETWTYQATGTASTLGQYSNNASVDGDYSGTPVSDSDPSNYFCYIANINVEKATNGQDADTPTGPNILVGAAVTWTYQVTTTANVPITNVVLTDDNGTPGNPGDDFSPTFTGGDTNSNSQLDAGETWTYQTTSTAVAGQYENYASVTGDDPNSNPVTDDDPSHYFGANPDIDIEKATNSQDADSPTGPYLEQGSGVTWTYVVTNPGNVPISNVVVVDDNGTPGNPADDFNPAFTGGDTNSNSQLDVGETWTYQATGTATTLGQYTNIVTVDGDFNTTPVSDNDPSNYYCYTANIDIEKATNGQDADSPTGPDIPIGNTVTWTYTVTTTGNAPLSNVVVTDDNGTPGNPGDDFNPTFTGGDTNSNNQLDPGETWTYQATGTATAGQYENYATVTGDDPNSNPKTDNDPSHYRGVNARIHIEKATDGQDADTPTGPEIWPPNTVTWTYVVTNTGDVALENVSVTDDNGTPGNPADDFNPVFTGGDTNGNSRLDLTETWTYQATGTATAGQYENYGTANSTYQGAPVTDDDPSHYFGPEPGIDIEKATNGQDADSPTGPHILQGNAVTWTYVVTNTGNVPLSNVVVTDDNGTPGNPADDFNPAFTGGDTNSNNLLDLTETWTYSASSTASVLGQYENIGYVTGDYDTGSDSDSDYSHYYCYMVGIDIEKATNGQDADLPTGPTVYETAIVTWTYVVTNSSNVAISNVVVTDDNGTPGNPADDFNPVFTGGDTNSNNQLDITETWTYEATNSATAGQYENEATVTGEDPNSNPVSDSDPSHYIGIELGSIGDFVWHDKNKDGAQDPGEPGIANVTLYLYIAGNPVDTMVTNATGFYDFTGLVDTTYTVDVDESSIPNNYILTTANEPYTYTLAPSEDHNDADFGYKASEGTIGDEVWLDLNGDATRTSNEPGIENVSVQLINDDGDVISTLSTDAVGWYRFYHLLPGTYVVNVVESTLPAGSALTTANEPMTVTIGLDEEFDYADFGYKYAPGSIGDFVWEDTNRDGIQDPGEPGLPDITVTLLDTLGNAIATTSTDNSGLYLFETLTTNTYVVDVNGNDEDMPDGYYLTTGNDPMTVTITPGLHYRDADFGFMDLPSGLGVIGDYAWHDANWDRVQDPNEEELSYVLVSLFQAGMQLRSMKTDHFGYYLFPNLPPGEYDVRVDVYGPSPSSDAAGISENSKKDDPTSGAMADVNWVITTVDSFHVSLSEGEIFLDADFGFAYPSEANPGTIGDYVWYDANQDAVQDAAESGIDGVTVFLKQNGEIIDTQITDPTGYYDFLNLLPGDYVVDVDETTLPEHYTLTTANEPFSVYLPGAEDFNDADFGYVEKKPWDDGRRYVLARYQPWYGDAENDFPLRHWAFDNDGGSADTCLFDTYDALEEKVWEYHILLAWASGIDGFVVDWFGQNSFGNPGLKGLLNKADELNQMYQDNGFRFEIAVSYNEMALGNLDPNMQFIGDSLMIHPAYWGLTRDVRRPLFIYNDEEDMITADMYRSSADSLLPDDAFLLWNGTEIEVFDPMDVCYPWVQPLNNQWDALGLEWGSTYLDTTYERMNVLPDPGDLLFALGSVWPGFDDRSCSWGQDHWMDRQDTLVYQWTWDKVHNYNRPLPMPWCLIETWNDFNRATEIEPSLDHGYKFIVQTRTNARRFKGIPFDSVGVENLGLLVPQHIHQARIAADLVPEQADNINTLITRSLNAFFNRDHLTAISLADQAAGIAPSPLVVETIGDTLIQVSWEAAEKADQYHIYIASDSVVFNQTILDQVTRISAGSNTELTITGLQPDTPYYLAVTAGRSELGPYANESWFMNSVTDAGPVMIRTEESVISPVQESGLIPGDFALYQNFPNPFNPGTTINYALPRNQYVKLRIFDMQGREVWVLVNEKKQAGSYSVSFDASHMGSGVYFYRLDTDEFSDIKKMILMK